LRVPATTEAATVTITIAGGTASPEVPASPTSQAAFEQAPDGDGDGSNRGALLAFGAIALALIGAIVGAVAWRSRYGG
jgi:hypothetical protein